MPGIENSSLPPRIEWDFAPVMFKMNPDQTYLISRYGADLSTNGAPLGLTDAQGNELFPGARPTVRVIIGEKGDCDYLDVTDISACPWYHEETKTAGNFALFRWTNTGEAQPKLAGAETLAPEKILTLGHGDTIFTATRYPETVAKEHVTIGIQSRMNDYRLIVRNHGHTSRTEVWNMQYDSTVSRPALLQGEALANARNRNTLRTLGNIGTKKSIEPPGQSKKDSRKT